MQELCTVADLALRAIKVTLWSLGQAISIFVVQECHPWLNLSDMRETNKYKFLDSPISQAGQEFCPAILGSTEADGGYKTHPAPVARYCLHPAASCRTPACLSPKAPSCGLHLCSCAATAVASTQATAWSWPYESGTAHLCPC